MALMLRLCWFPGLLSVFGDAGAASSNKGHVNSVTSKWCVSSFHVNQSPISSSIPPTRIFIRMAKTQNNVATYDLPNTFLFRFFSNIATYVFLTWGLDSPLGGLVLCFNLT